MSDQDPISTMLTVIRNGQMANKKQVTVTHSNVKASILDVLKDEGFIRSYATVETAVNKRSITISLKYTEDNIPVIQTIKRVSSPGLRVYKKYTELTKVKDGLGISVISTSEGVMTGFDAFAKKLGGELLCQVT